MRALMHTGHLLQPILLANIGICAAYTMVFFALTVTRYRFLFLRPLTRAAGATFFLTCGLHHLMNVLELVNHPDQPYASAMLHWPMLVIDAVQVVAVWVFAVSAGQELRDIASLRRNGP